jgi:tripartite-type tricarboxylate transporter receptor subunit TctC
MEKQGGIAAPARTPVPIIERLQREIAGILLTNEARSYFESYGREPVASTPAAFAAFIRAEHEKWGLVIHDSNIRAE